MRTLPRVLFAISAVSFIALVGLRVGMPQAVINTNEGFVLNVAAAFLFFWGLAEWKSVPLGVSPWGGFGGGRTLALVSTFVTAFAVDYVLGLRFAGDELISPLGFFVYLPWAGLALFGWWSVIFRSRETLQLNTRPIYAIGILFIAAAVIYTYVTR